jgi:thioredoxin-related protein
MKKLLTALLLAVSFAPAATGSGEGAWLEDWDAAFRKAAAEKKVVLVEFQAVWCYSCYYMQKVLATPGFREAVKDAVLLQMDIDKPEGRARKEKHKVVGVPTFLLMDSGGHELGRISSEHPEAEFLALLRGIMGGKPSGGADPELLAARSGLAAAKKAKAPAAAAEALSRLLDLEEGCDLPADVDEALDASAGVPEARRKELLLKTALGLEAHAAKKVFGARADRCADMRTAPYLLNAVYKELGEKDKAAAAFDRIIVLLKKDVDDLGVGADRNLDDNLRFFLELAGRNADLDGLYPKLIAAYPADYVYSFRYAKNLHGRKDDGAALAYIEKGVALSYGGNRIGAAVLKGRILAGLGRKEEALRLLEAEKRAAKGRFPKELSGFDEAIKELR